MSRARRRLEIARDLMEASGESLQNTLRRIRGLADAERDDLRGAVDWVEDYEEHEPQS